MTRPSYGRCSNCQYWTGTYHGDDPGDDFGECRRNPPTDSDDKTFDEHRIRRFPETTDDDWCGEWRDRTVV